MKSLQESLFDKDLMNKSVSVPADAFWNMVFEDVYCPLRKKCIDAGWLLDLNNDGLKVYKTFYDTNDQSHKVRVRLIFDTGVVGYPIFPQIDVARQWGLFDMNFSDGNATRRWLIKKDHKHFMFEEGHIEGSRDTDMHFVCTTDTVDSIINLMKSMIGLIISKNYTNLIQDEIDKYASKNKIVPGIIIDQVIMKPLIKDA